MPKKISMNQFAPKKEDIIVLDTNIFIDLFYPMNPGKNVSDTANVYAKILKSGAQIIVSAIQVSEFVNRCIRFQFDLYREEHPECVSFKKDYRGTEDYSQCMQIIVDIIANEWSEKVVYVDDNFNKLPIEKILSYKFSYDFNDALLVEIANQYNATIVTNDADIINYEVKNAVVSSNQFLLAVR